MSTWTVTVPDEADDRLVAAVLECVEGDASWHTRWLPYDAVVVPELGVSVTRAGEGAQ